MLGWFLSRPRLLGILFLLRYSTVREERRYAHTTGLNMAPGSGRGVVTKRWHWYILSWICHGRR